MEYTGNVTNLEKIKNVKTNLDGQFSFPRKARKKSQKQGKKPSKEKSHEISLYKTAFFLAFGFFSRLAYFSSLLDFFLGKEKGSTFSLFMAQKGFNS